MPRPLWKGHINFGLVSIPVGLYPAEEPKSDIAFRLLDRRNLSPIHNQRVNDQTGNIVPWEEVVKGYEYEGGKFVVISQEDFVQANVTASQSVDILDFVDADEIDPMYFIKPYFLAPSKHGEKGYVILREALKSSGKIGIGKVVLRTREHLAAIIARGRSLVLETLRFSDELRDPKDLDIPAEDTAAYGVKKLEVDLAQRLIEGMTQAWKPENYRDDYREDLMKAIETKLKAGGVSHAESPAKGRKGAAKGEVIDMMDLLKRSLAGSERQGSRKRGPAARARKPAESERKSAQTRKRA